MQKFKHGKVKYDDMLHKKLKRWGTKETDTPSQIPWSVLSPLWQAIWLTTTSIPKMALLKRDGTYVNDDIELSEIAQYCTMCPMESWDIWDNCLADGECQSWVCEEITQGKCVSWQYGEKFHVNDLRLKSNVLVSNKMYEYDHD